MNVETPTIKLSFQVWWAWLWRVLPLTFFLGFLIGFTIGMAAQIFGFPVPTLLVSLLGLPVGIVVSVKMMQRLMTKGFGKYRLVVVKK